jgi:hypothetical protein
VPEFEKIVQEAEAAMRNGPSPTLPEDHNDQRKFDKPEEKTHYACNTDYFDRHYDLSLAVLDDWRGRLQSDRAALTEFHSDR